MWEIYCKPKQRVLLKHPRITGGEWLPMYKDVDDDHRWTVTVIGSSPRKIVFAKTYEDEDSARKTAEFFRAAVFPAAEVFYPNPEPFRAAL